METAPSIAPAALEVREVSVRFGDHWALDGVDLQIRAGRVLALLGPSGCGKTTLLRVIAGLQTPTSGCVLIDGEDQASVAPHRRGIGLMFQEYALFPHRDVGANVAFGLQVRGDARSVIEARVAEVLELVGLAGYGGRAVGGLSGGEQQRVALARSLAPEPRVLMLDEPLGALDRSLRDRLVGDLQALFAELGVTVVYVTHDQGEALALADDIAVLDAGRVVQVGAPNDLWSAPANEFVARFLGFVNVIEVDIRAGRVDSPWGSFADVAGSADGRRRVVVRPEAVIVTSAGPASSAGPQGHDRSAGVPATVVGRLFRGNEVQLDLVAGSGHRLDATVAPRDAPALGDAVRVRIDGRGVFAVG